MIAKFGKREGNGSRALRKTAEYTVTDHRRNEDF